MTNTIRRAYIARYPLASEGNDLTEEILIRDTYWSPKLRAEWTRLASERNPNEPMLQAWYADAYCVTCLAETNQPFKLR